MSTICIKYILILPSLSIHRSCVIEFVFVHNFKLIYFLAPLNHQVVGKMRRVLSLFLLGGLLIAVHALPQAKLRAKRGFNLFKMFNNKRAEIQNNADGANKSPPAQEPKSNIFELAPPAPPAPPPAPPIQDVEGSWCAPGWYHAQIASECIKIFEGEQDIVTLVEAKRNCEQLPSYMGESASLLEVSAGKPVSAVISMSCSFI